jgi:TolB-like protein/cytochrome c-type biogenesis protein CcmH/NrfG
MKSYQEFFAELKRRKVFKVAGVYGVVAFVLLQVADLLGQGLRLPDSFMPFITAVVLLGFPLALILAWAFEVTPDGVQRTEAAATGEIEAIVAEPASKRWPAGLLALVGMAALLAGAWWAGRTTAPGMDGSEASGAAGARLAFDSPADDDRPSIAVLPFVNMSADPEQEYFSDGITEEILNVLARLEGLRVTARTSTFAFKGENIDLRAVGDSLGVRYLIEGSVRKAGDQLRITAQLIDASDGSHLWSESYDRRMVNVFEIQSDIAESVAAALTVPLGLAGAERLVAPTADLEAYDLYLAGRARMRERGASLLEARNLFEAAIARDSNWAPAWAALAEVSELRIWHAYARPPDMERAEFHPIALDEAETAARRALELDPSNGSALVALGSVHRNRADWEQAEAAYLRALELDPDNPEAHQQYGDYLLNVGRIADGVRAMDRAAALDPAPIRLAMLAFALLADDRLPEAIDAYELSAALEKSPTERARTHSLLARTALVAGRDERAIEAYDAAWRENPEVAPIGGPRARIDQVVRALRSGDLASAPADFDTDGMRASQWLMVGEPDRAIDRRIELSDEQPFGRVIEFWLPHFDAIRSEPRIERYLAERGLAGVEARRTPPEERSRPMVLQRLDSL